MRGKQVLWDGAWVDSTGDTQVRVVCANCDEEIHQNFTYCPWCGVYLK